MLSRSRLLLPLLFFASGVFAADRVPVLKAKVEEPVLEELLGGCSLKCAFAWSVEFLPAAGAKGQPIRLLNDESAQTAWVSPAPGSGVGARFRLVFPKKLAPEMEGEVPIYGLDVINGFWKSEELWAQHSRLKRVRVYYRDRPFKEIVFSDSRRWQRVIFDDIMVRSGDSLTLEVLEVYPGKSAGLALTELVLAGGH